METFLILFIGGTLIGLGLMGSRSRFRDWERAVTALRDWERAVTACGLQVLETSSFVHSWLRASSGPLEVRIEQHGNPGALLVVMGPGPPDFHSVSIRPQNMLRIGREIETGDERFDSKFFIEGPTQLVLALLDQKVRSLLTGMEDESQVEIFYGEIRAVVAEDAKVHDVLVRLLEIHKRLAPPLEIGQRLADNITLDPEPGVRLRNLLLLIHERRHQPGTAEVLRKACADPVPEIRLRAARELGAEGRSVLLDLAEKQEDDAASAVALSIVGGELPFERMNAILDLALSHRHLRSAHACLGMIGRHGAVAVDKLAQVLKSHYGELAPAAAEALGATASPDAESTLIQALQRDEIELQVAAANALGQVGSTAAVPPLKEAGERFDLGLRRSTRQAIAEIQSRAKGASPGQLSLADGQAGQLSLAHDPAGQLSLEGDD